MERGGEVGNREVEGGKEGAGKVDYRRDDWTVSLGENQAGVTGNGYVEVPVGREIRFNGEEGGEGDGSWDRPGNGGRLRPDVECRRERRDW